MTWPCVTDAPGVIPTAKLLRCAYRVSTPQAVVTTPLSHDIYVYSELMAQSTNATRSKPPERSPTLGLSSTPNHPPTPRSPPPPPPPPPSHCPALPAACPALPAPGRSGALACGWHNSPLGSR